jgi:hypothetical protein
MLAEARVLCSHERWRHPLLKKTMTIPGKDGSGCTTLLRKATC